MSTGKVARPRKEVQILVLIPVTVSINATPDRAEKDLLRA